MCYIFAAAYSILEGDFEGWVTKINELQAVCHKTFAIASWKVGVISDWILAIPVPRPAPSREFGLREGFCLRLARLLRDQVLRAT